MAAWTLTKLKFSGDIVSRSHPSDAVLEATLTTGSDAYATGGLVLADLATYFATVTTIECIEAAVAKVAYRTFWDAGTVAAGKVIITVEDGTSGIQAQVADMADLSTTPGTLRVRITGTMLGTYSAASPTSSSNLGAY